MLGLWLRVYVSKDQKNLVNALVQYKQMELVKKFKMVVKTFFIPASQQKFISRYAGDGQITLTQVIAYSDDNIVFADDLNQYIGIQYYHAREGQAAERISTMDGKEGSKIMSSQNFWSFKLSGKEGAVFFWFYFIDHYLHFFAKQIFRP